MTTIDVWIGCDDPAKRIELHSTSLGGPAAEIIALIRDALADGRLAGRVEAEVEADAVPGGVLREVLSPLADKPFDRPLTGNSPLFGDCKELLDYLDDSTTYSVRALEV